MPAEDIRRRLAADPKLYPELAPAARRVASSRETTPGVISITSSATSTSSRSDAPVATPHATQAAKGVNGKTPIVITSSDDESDDDPPPLGSIDYNAAPVNTDGIRRVSDPSNKGKGRSTSGNNTMAANNAAAIPNRGFTKPPVKIAGPSSQPAYPAPIANGYHAQQTQRKPSANAPLEEAFYNAPPIGNEFLTQAETEKALKDLISGIDSENIVAEINEDDTIVKGFKEGIRLLPHQVHGRNWMTEREDPTRKRNGGILADDMGLGKTIQTLTRVVLGRARSSDKEDGWAPTTLVICPLALLGQWASEIAKICVGLTVIEHHGSNRTSDTSVLTRAHVVLTTYDVVKSEYATWEPSAAKDASAKPKKKSADSSDDDSDVGSSLPVKKPRKGGPKTALFRIKWWRVVLDEGHNIKNRATKASLSCAALDAKFRWVLTGTPMQNDVTELYSLFRFLKVKPLNDWTLFNEQVAKPIKNGRGASRAMGRLQVVLKSVMLRRKKTDLINGVPLIQLPARNVEILSCAFNKTEQIFYTALETKLGVLLEKLIKKGGNYTSVLVLLLRLRQACNHPCLVSKDYKKDVEGIDPAAVKEGQDVGADADDLVAAFGQLGVTRKCAMCQIQLEGENPNEKHCDTCRPLVNMAEELEGDTSSAKIRMIVQLLDEINERSDGKEKTIIFSQFTSMLDLIQPFLREKGIRFVRYDGSMPKDEREYSLEKIKSSTNIRVILISFKAGSTGLNLTACNNVILVDIWWNPALEDQAFDRAHRFGQTRDVNIWKLKIDNTVEDRILELQEKKRILAAAALSGDKIKNMKLGMNELLALFRPGGRDDDDEDDY